MKNYELLESIGSIDEDLLQECETIPFTKKRTGLKILLVAAIIAMLSVAAVATKNSFHQDVTGGEVVQTTFHIKSYDAEFNVTKEESIGGVIITAEIDTIKDVPMKLLYPYLPKVPEDWVCSGAGSGKYDGEIGMVGVQWTFQEDGREYEVFYRQESVYFYNTSDDHAVWWMDRIPEDVTITDAPGTICDVPVYIVSVSKAQKNTPYDYYTFPHSLIFWSDGYSIFQLDVPQHWEEARIYELMCSLTLQDDIGTAISNLNKK